MTDTTLTRLEYWDARLGDWVVGHAGVGLLHPERYSQRLAANGKVGRAIVVETGEVFQSVATPEPQPTCLFCDERHPEPHDGGCLL